MNKSSSRSKRYGVLSFVPLALLLPACTVYQDSPAPSTSVTYVDTPAADEDSAYVVIRNEDDFYEPLSPYGHWEEVDDVGRCWVPGRVDRDWRPYSSGHWRRTDAGWYWDSDEPWGWATYHYGRWDHSERFGWYWVPQTQWAPSWVSWHQGGGYVGWAPLRPSGKSRRDVTVDVNIRDDSSPQNYVFVQEKQFLQPVRPANVVINNTTVINQTTNITNIKVVNKTVINEGPRTEVIERATGQRVQPVSAHTVRREREAKVPAPHQTTHARTDEKTTQSPREGSSAPHARPAPVPREAEAPVASRAVPKDSERNRSDEPKRVSPVDREREKQIQPDRKPEGEKHHEGVAPAVEQKKHTDDVRPKVEKKKTPSPKEPTHAKDSPAQAKHDAEKRAAEKRATEKEQETVDQSGKSESTK